MEKWQTENKEKLTNVLKKWGISINFLKNLKSSDGQQINFSAENVSTPDQRCFTLENVGRQVNLTIDQLGKIIGSENLYSISDDSLERLEGNIKSLQESVLALYNSCANLNNRDENTEYSIDKTMNISYQFQEKMVKIPVTKMFKKILNDSASLLDSTSCIPYMPKGKKSHKFTIHSNLWEQTSVQAEASLNKIKKDRQDIEAQSIEIQKLYTKATNAQAEITNLFNQSELASTSIGQNKTEIEANKTRIDEVIKKSENLKELVNNYQSNFDIFTEHLSERDEKWKEIEEKIEKTHEKIQKHEEKARTILHMSDSAKLSENFKIREKSISSNLLVARVFHFLVLLIFIGYSLFLFDFLGVLKGNFDFSTLTLGVILLKFTLVLPVLLLVGFTNRQYKELFKLKEHYAYKDSIASSIPSFKDQSGDYGELVATTLFSKLTFNPADDIGKKKDKSDYIEEPEALYKSAIDSLKKKITNKEEISYKTAIDAIEKEIANKRKISYKETFEAIEKEIAIIEELIDEDDTETQDGIDAIKKIIADTKETDTKENN